MLTIEYKVNFLSPAQGERMVARARVVRPGRTVSVCSGDVVAITGDNEKIVATMEGGQLPLAEALAAYQRGAELLQYCQAALKDAEQQVQVLERGVLKAFAPAEPDAAASGSEGSGPVEGDVS